MKSEELILKSIHFGYSIWYSLLTFPMGILLAKTFIISQERKESSFWITTAVHSLRNLIGVIAELNNGMRNEIPELKNPFSIPHYFIIDENGEVISPNTPSLHRINKKQKLIK